MELKRLFSPIMVKNIMLKNRVLMPALHHLYTPEGYATERFNEYYWRRAEGGAGLIFVGGCRFDDYGGAPLMMSLQSDDFIPGFREFTDGMHQRGAKVGVQLYHAGAYASKAAIPGFREALAPSEVFSKFTKEMPHEMTKADIKQVTLDWAAGAARAKRAGFDIVEILASAGYIICQFLSPLKNLRSDEYGGSFSNRTRFAREVVSAVRAAVGDDYPLSMRIAGNDFVENSNTNINAVSFCKLMEECGVDMFNVTGGWHESTIPQITGDLPRGGFAYLAAAIKDAVGIPVAVSNRINDPLLAEKLLALGVADMISVGRPHIADPDWAVKAQSGRFDEIRRCVACNQGCLSRMFSAKPVACTVNGAAGLEYMIKASAPADPVKNILVIGGGSAGCEFAIRAVERGHKVQIWESGANLGGQLELAAAPPGKGEFSTLISYFTAMLRKLDIPVVLNKTLSIENIEEIRGGGFDLVVTATGATPNVIPLPGITTAPLPGKPGAAGESGILCEADRPGKSDVHAESGIPVYTAYDVLRNEVIPGRDVLIIGGGAVGCETAQYLARDAGASPELLGFLLEHQAESIDKIRSIADTTRRNISIVDIDKIGAGFEPGTGWPVFKDLKRLGVRQYPFAAIESIADRYVTIAFTDKTSCKGSGRRIDCGTAGLDGSGETTRRRIDCGTAGTDGSGETTRRRIDCDTASLDGSGETTRRRIDCDTIVLAVGAKPNDTLYRELTASGVNVRNIGDSAGVRKVLDAIREADALALEI
ncbi:MAG: FAD-dependent oxidoreductase [Clostridiales Family XIII bacterium]|jgi:2,4-dienoyl-CoA reductase (NADPH2)|nr:FAD-dependent oxidoreductase [Clostridiales Family XIII bacterium]